MASEAQIAANRANARQSTGPRSAAGKARVAQNGLKHGLCSTRVLLPDEDEAAFEALVDDLKARWAPADDVELALLREYAAAMWRLDRIPGVEADLLRAPEDADPEDWDLGRAFLARSKEILRLSLHESRLSRQRERARKELEALQAARRRREAELALDWRIDQAPPPAHARRLRNGAERPRTPACFETAATRPPQHEELELGFPHNSLVLRSARRARLEGRGGPEESEPSFASFSAAEREQNQPLAEELALLRRKAA